LIRAALELIARKGTAGLLSPRPRASPASARRRPHRHFRDRDELRANVALRDSEQFAAALARAQDDGRSDEFIALPVSPFAKSIQADSSTV